MKIYFCHYKLLYSFKLVRNGATNTNHAYQFDLLARVQELQGREKSH